MSEFFQSEMEELEKIVDFLKDFIISNNKNIKFTEYYITLGNKNFLQSLEDTFDNFSLSENKKIECVKLMKTFLEKLKSLYDKLCLETNSQSLRIKVNLEEAAVFLGFSEDKNNLFSKLENTINRIENQEILQ